jgi:hypothetical protein
LPCNVHKIIQVGGHRDHKYCSCLMLTSRIEEPPFAPLGQQFCPLLWTINPDDQDLGATTAAADVSELLYQLHPHQSWAGVNWYRP